MASRVDYTAAATEEPVTIGVSNMAANKPVCEEWTLEALAEHFYFVHHHMRDHRYVWVLGAGASKSSGVPLGSELVDMWLRDLALRAGAEDRIEKWAEKELQLNNLQWQNTPFTWDNRAAFYSQVYDVRFRDNPDEGYAFLESKLGGADPSPGYSILASILEGPPVPAQPGEKGPRTKQEPRHNAVITTNFDDLVADALAIYTDTRPFVCGHESLTGYVRVAMRRPLVCKIHRDLLTGPQNSARGLRRLHDAWGGPLRALLQHYTPIFIGYGGNDDSVMDLLESLDPGDIHGQPIWCYYSRDPRSPDRHRPGQRIQELIKHHNGVVVPTPDFDLLMILLGQQVGVEVRDDEIEQRAKSRASRYRQRVLDLDTLRYPQVENALLGIYQRSGGAWAWIVKAERQTNLNYRDQVYQRALEEPEYKSNPTLLRHYGVFLAEEMQDLERALPIFNREVGIDSTNVEALGNLALCYKGLGNEVLAEAFYKRAIEADPKHASCLGNYAAFLHSERHDYDQAETLYKLAIEADPKHANNLGNYAAFLHSERHDYDQAETLYKLAIEADPKHANNLGNYANFLRNESRDYDQAEAFYKLAIEADPKNANRLGNYANFLCDERHDYDQAEDFYKRAIEADPKNANHLGNYAELLTALGRYVEAIDLALRGVDLVNGSDPGRVASLAWTKAVALSLDGEDDKGAIEAIRTSLASGLISRSWKVDDVLREHLKDKLPAAESQFFLALADAISKPDEKIDIDQLLRERDSTKSKQTKRKLAAGPEGSKKKSVKKTPKLAPKKTPKSKDKSATKRQPATPKKKKRPPK
jgi:Tfp pilus assembly protein PilF